MQTHPDDFDPAPRFTDTRTSDSISQSEVIQMRGKKSATKAAHKRFSPEFKQPALLRAAKDGTPAVARGLGLEPAQLYGWRTKAQQTGRGRRDAARAAGGDGPAQARSSASGGRARVPEKAAAYFAKQPK